jgi:hypothetical protein
MRDRDEFVQLRARLHAVASSHGDRPFADAIGKCIVDASGGTPACPMAKLFLEQYVATGRPPKTTAPAPLPTTAMLASSPSRYDRQKFLDYIHRAVEDRALTKHDDRYVEALRACGRAMRESPDCPLHVAWIGMLPPSRSDGGVSADGPRSLIDAERKT